MRTGVAHGIDEAQLEAEVISANIEFYRNIATKYDEYETCVRTESLQGMLRSDLAQFSGLLNREPETVRCLDCGGGSGNISLKLLEMGYNVTIVDVSSDMLDLLKARVRTSGFRPILVHSSIEAFLESTNDRYDVITFNSVLHHLYSYLGVIDRVTDHINPGGLFYSNCDPAIPRSRFSPKLLELLDTLLAKAFHDPSDFLPGIARRARKALHGPNQIHRRAVASAGDLAEYHARCGVDDHKIVSHLQNRDFCILNHQRWTGGRTWLARTINDRLRLLETFKILARRSE